MAGIRFYTSGGTGWVASVVLTSGYDGWGNRASLGASVGGTTRLTDGYQYDALGRVTAVTQSGSAVAGKGAGFTYNALGQLTAVDGHAGTNQTGLVYSAGYGYDAAGRLTSLGYTSAAEANPAGYVYTYDADGRVTGETNVDGTVAYAYDADSRLTAATGGGLTAAESYAYDATGNRTDTGDAMSSGNRLASDGTYDYAYDANGNLLTKTTIATGATTTYAWDYRNRLTDVTDRTAGGTITGQVHYTYDAFDRRIGQQVDGNGDGTYDSVERYVYDGSSLLLTLSGTGVITHAYLNGPAGANQVLADDAAGSGVTWLLADRLGSVRDVISSSGTVVDHLQYDSYGNVTAQSNAGNQPRFGYAGMQRDAATGLYYDNARYYDAGTGTFISQDPSGFAGGNANLYGYVNNDLTNLVDPSGLSPKGSGGGGGGGGGGGSNGSNSSSGRGHWAITNGIYALTKHIFGPDHPVTVGTEWLTGEGDRDRNFDATSPFTQMLMQHAHIQDATNDVIARLNAGDPTVTNPSGVPYPYKLDGLQGIPKYVNDYSTLLTAGQTGNLAVTYLGSYGMNIRVQDVNTTSGTATLDYTVTNSSTLGSGIRPPVLGYTDFWHTHVEPYENPVSGPMSKTTQTFHWQTTVNWK